MSTVIPREHDYIGLSETTSKVISHDTATTKNDSSLKETELRLGLPGSQSPERTVVNGTTVSLFGKDIVEPLKNSLSGAKRGFSDAIDGNSEKWGFISHVGISVNGSDANDFVKKAPLLSPRPVKNDAVGVGVDGVQSTKPVDKNSNQQVSVVNDNTTSSPASKAQVVGWPPIRSFRKNTMSSNSAKSNEDAEGKLGYEGLYVKVSMDGAPYLRKVDLKTYNNYVELSSSLEKMFRCFTIGQCSSRGLPGRDGLSASHLKDLLHGSEYVLTYEDKDGDWMLVGDVPWEMFTDSCKRLRIMKGSEAIGLAPRVMEKCKK